MDRARLLMITRAIIILSTAILITGCNFGSGQNNPTVNITSPSGDVTITAGDSVDFECTVSNGTSPYTFQWDFGGGATNSSVENPGSIVFSTAGNYTVTLTVTDGSGETAQASVIVSVQTSTAFSVIITSPSSDQTISAGQSVNFQSTASNGTSPYIYQWDFDGGASNSNVQNPGSITFIITGTYKVTLTGTDGSGAKSQASVVVTVQ
jgi:PKD repeat protein